MSDHPGTSEEIILHTLKRIELSQERHERTLNEFMHGAGSEAGIKGRMDAAEKTIQLIVEENKTFKADRRMFVILTASTVLASLIVSCGAVLMVGVQKVMASGPAAVAKP
jgi:hypothetical protein